MQHMLSSKHTLGHATRNYPHEQSVLQQFAENGIGSIKIQEEFLGYIAYKIKSTDVVTPSATEALGPRLLCLAPPHPRV
jgi:hypothetical protein